jgi:sugar phosphate isomerase/epimerase
MTIEIGLQLYSVRNELRKDYRLAIEKVAAIGYKNVELISTVTDDGLTFAENMQPPEHRRLLDHLGLKAIGCHVMPTEGMGWEKVLNSCAETGAAALVIPFAFFNDRQDVLSLCALMNRVAEQGKKIGVQLYYHNHFQEFQQFDGQMVLDIMLENTDRDLVKFEFDTYWAIRGGQDAVAWIRKLGSRCDLLHQKDMPSTVSPVNLFELRSGKPEITIREMFQTISIDQFAEISSGVINIPAILEAGRIYGDLRYIFVEQDMTSKDEMESVAISFHNLTRLLNG